MRKLRESDKAVSNMTIQSLDHVSSPTACLFSPQLFATSFVQVPNMDPFSLDTELDSLVASFEQPAAMPNLGVSDWMAPNYHPVNGEL